MKLGKLILLLTSIQEEHGEDLDVRSGSGSGDGEMVTGVWVKCDSFAPSVKLATPGKRVGW